MKKWIIGALVSAIILFIWQFISYTAGGLHAKAQQYTPKQEQVLKALAESGLEEGGYIMPNVPENTSMDEAEAIGKTWQGKPWAIVQYHNSYDMQMGPNMVRGLFANLVAMGLLVWLLLRLENRNFRNIVAASLVVGVILFIVEPYTSFIWYKGFDIWGHAADAVVPWLLIGAWLGWYLQDRRRSRVIYRAPEEKSVMA